MRKVFICKSCKYPYPDAPVSQCDCVPTKQEYEIGYIVDASFLETFESTRSSVNFDLLHYLTMEKKGSPNSEVIAKEIERLQTLKMLIETAALQKEVLDEDSYT